MHHFISVLAWGLLKESNYQVLLPLTFYCRNSDWQKRYQHTYLMISFSPGYLIMQIILHFTVLSLFSHCFYLPPNHFTYYFLHSSCQDHFIVIYCFVSARIKSRPLIKKTVQDMTETQGTDKTTMLEITGPGSFSLIRCVKHS